MVLPKLNELTGPHTVRAAGLIRGNEDPVLLAGDQVLRAVVSEQRGVFHAGTCYLLVPFGDGVLMCSSTEYQLSRASG
jgi:hypothetical protein